MNLFINKLILVFLITLALFSAFSVNIYAQDINIENTEDMIQKGQTLDKSVVFILSLILILIVLFMWEPMPISLLAVLVPIILSIFNGLSNMTVEEALSGAFLMVFSGCINKSDFFKSIDWEVYFLLSGLIPMGIAIEKSGTAAFLAEQITNLSDLLPPLYILMLIYFITSTMATLVGNNTSVLIMLPIAFSTAGQLGVNPFAFILTTTFAASSAFSSPVGYQTNLMVYSSGGFKFRDFIIVGAPLQLLLTVTVPILVWLFWGF